MFTYFYYIFISFFILFFILLLAIIQFVLYVDEKNNYFSYNYFLFKLFFFRKNFYINKLYLLKNHNFNQKNLFLWPICFFFLIIQTCLFLYHLYLYFDLILYGGCSFFFECSLVFLTTTLFIDPIAFIFLILLFFVITLCCFSYVTKFLILVVRKSHTTFTTFDFFCYHYQLKLFIYFFFNLFFLQLILFFFFTVSDLFFFYIFFELAMLPVCFLIRLYGSRINRIKASIYLFVYTLLSSVPFLLGIFLLWLFLGTTDYFYLISIFLPQDLEFFVWICFFIPIAVKIPMVPFHVWLPEAHVEAPTEGSMILAGLLLKLGSYAFVRYLIPLCPISTIYYMPLLYTISILSVFYISCSIFCQIDLKKIIAYSSIIHMNFALLGLYTLTVEGVLGSLYLFFTHGIISTGLFYCIGFLYARYHTRLICYYSGLSTYYPVFSLFFFILCLGNFSFPGTGGFIGEFLILLGLFQKSFFIGLLALICSFTGALYTLLLFSRIMFGNFFFFSEKLPFFFLKVNINFENILKIKKNSINLQNLFISFFSKKKNETKLKTISFFTINIFRSKKLMPIYLFNTLYMYLFLKFLAPKSLEIVSFSKNKKLYNNQFFIKFFFRYYLFEGEFLILLSLVFWTILTGCHPVLYLSFLYLFVEYFIIF